MFGADKGALSSEDHKMDGKKLHIGIVQARFNDSITDELANACKAELLALGVADKHIHLVQVPGALEIQSSWRRWPRAINTMRWSL